MEEAEAPAARELPPAQVRDQRRRVPATAEFGRRVHRPDPDPVRRRAPEPGQRDALPLRLPEPDAFLVGREHGPEAAATFLRIAPQLLGYDLILEVLDPAGDELEIVGGGGPRRAGGSRHAADLRERVDPLSHHPSRGVPRPGPPGRREGLRLRASPDDPGSWIPADPISSARRAFAPSATGCARTRLCGGVWSAAPITVPASSTLQRCFDG